MKVFATFAKLNEGTWRLTAVSAFSADRARSLAEREQRRPGSAIRNSDLTVLEFDSLHAVPWHLPASPAA